MCLALLDIPDLPNLKICCRSKDLFLLDDDFIQKSLVQVNLCQKSLFLHQLNHNITTDCSMNYEFSTWKLQGQNMLCTQIVFVLTSRTIYVHNMFWPWIFMYWTRRSMNNVSSYCGLIDGKIKASDKGITGYTCKTA